MTRVLYGKIGRTMALDPAKWGAVGGDNEPVNLLLELAHRHPDVEWVLGTRYAVTSRVELPSNITLPDLPKLTSRNSYPGGVRKHDPSVNPWEETAEALRPYFRDADGVVMWAGQMGTSNLPIPKVEDRSILTEPQDSFMSYVGPTTLNINEWRDPDPLNREEIWLCSDPRNYLKAREVKWPPRHPIMSQYTWTREQRHERFGDPRDPAYCSFSGEWDRGTWLSPHRYTYDALEIVGIPDWVPERDFDERDPFRILINETRGYVALNRADVVRAWVRVLLNEEQTNIHGKWTPKGAESAGIALPKPLHHSEVPDFLGGARCTFTTPASGSEWATAKPHEAFRLGTVCFFHPKYDAQGHIVPTLEAVEAGVIDHDPELKELARWLRPSTPNDLLARVDAVSSSRTTYEWLRDAQLRLEARFRTEQRAVKEIERRLGLG